MNLRSYLVSHVPNLVKKDFGLPKNIDTALFRNAAGIKINVFVDKCWKEIRNTKNGVKYFMLAFAMVEFIASSTPHINLITIPMKILKKTPAIGRTVNKNVSMMAI